MEETPRDYKKRVDETREKRRKNRDKFFEYLQEYELVDERFKAKTRQEILANFEKNEKAEKGSDLYTKIGEELDTIEIKYQSLESLKDLLETKNKEKTEIVEKLRGFSMTGKDETTLNLQRTEIKKLETEMKKLNEEIKEIEKIIQERESEIKETEEIYGEKVEKESGDQNSDDSITENMDNTQLKFSEGVTRPASLRDYRRFIINQLNGINHTRHEIIKLLNDGIGVDDEIKKRIEDEVSKKFFDYYDERQGTLRMKAAQSIGIRRNIYEIKNEEYEYKGYIGYIGGKPVFKAKKDGKYCIMRGNEQLGGGYDIIDDHFRNIGGKPCFIAEKHGKECVIRGNEELSEGLENINPESMENVGGKPCYIAKKKGKSIVFWGKEQIRERIRYYQKTQEIGGKPCFIAEKDGKECVMRGTEQQGDLFDYIHSPQEIGGKPCFVAKKKGKRCLMWGKEQQGDLFDYIDYLQEIGGKPCFIAKKDGKYCIVRGNEQISDWFAIIYDILKGIVLVRGNEQIKISDGFTNIYDYLKGIGGKPCFKVKKHGKRCVMRGDEQQGDWFDDLNSPQEIGGKPCFKAEKDGKYCIVRGNEQISDWFNAISDPIEIGGKPCYGAWDGKRRYVIQGKEVSAGRFDHLDICAENGGEPVYYAEKKNERYIMVGKKVYIDLNEKEIAKISDLNATGGKIFYKAHWNGLQCFMIGKQQYTDRCDDVKLQNVDKTKGTVTIETTQKGKNKIITFHINESGDIGESDAVNENGEIGQEEGVLDTQRGQREKVIIERYEKLLNLKELIKYLKESKILENSEFLELTERVTENFFENYENAKKDGDFQAADEKYKKLKELKKRHKEKGKELKSKLGTNNEYLKSIEKQMLEIADDAIDIESGVSIKRLMLSRVRKEREKLDAQKKNIAKLKNEKYRLKKQIEEQSQSYGQKIDRRKLRGKSEEELKKLLSIGRAAQAKTLKEYKEKHKEIVENFEKIIGYIKGLDLGICEEHKDEIIQKIENHISRIIESQEGGEIMKIVNDTEKYLDENLENIIKKLKELKKQVKETEEKITELEEKRKTLNDDELIEINDQIYEVMQQQIRLNNEYEEIKKTINEKLHKYDGSDIESRL